LEHDIKDSNYLGSVAVPRLADLEDLFAPAGRAPYDLPFFLAYGVKTVYPQFEPHEILSEKGFAFYGRIAESCEKNGTEPKADASGWLKANWENNEFVQKYFSRNRLGMQPSSASLLVIGSADDPTTAETKIIVERLCRQGSRVQFARYAES